MNMLFKIGCTSCRAQFAVHDPSLIGQIIACPKCGSMMLVERPIEENDALLSSEDASASNAALVSEPVAPSPNVESNFAGAGLDLSGGSTEDFAAGSVAETVADSVGDSVGDIAASSVIDSDSADSNAFGSLESNVERDESPVVRSFESNVEGSPTIPPVFDEPKRNDEIQYNIENVDNIDIEKPELSVAGQYSENVPEKIESVDSLRWDDFPSVGVRAESKTESFAENQPLSSSKQPAAGEPSSEVPPIFAQPPISPSVVRQESENAGNVPPRLETESELDEAAVLFYQNRLVLTLLGVAIAVCFLIVYQFVAADRSSPNPEPTQILDQPPSSPTDDDSSSDVFSDEEDDWVVETPTVAEDSPLTPTDDFDPNGSGLYSEPSEESATETETDASSESDPTQDSSSSTDETVEPSESEPSIDEGEPNSTESTDETDDSPNDAQDSNDSATPESEPSSEDNLDDEESETFEMTASTSESFQNSLPELKQIRDKLNVQNQLALSLKSVVFPQNSLPEIIPVLAGITNVPISVDLSSFELIRQSATTPVDYRAENKTIAEILKEIADLLKLKVRVEESQIILTAPDLERTTILETTFDVGDLVARPESSDDSSARKKVVEPNEESRNAAESFDFVASNAAFYSLSPSISTQDLRQMIERLVDPTSWEGQGGTATIAVDKQSNSLVIRQTEQNRRSVEKLLEQIRAIRRLPAQADVPQERLIPELLGWEKLSEKATLNYVEPVPLADIFALIAETQNLQFLFDENELLDSGVRLDRLAIIRITDGTIDQILTELLRPLQLSYIILAENLILITSKEKSQDYLTVEVQLYAKPDDPQSKNIGIDELCSLISSSVSPDSWSKIDEPNLENVSDASDDLAAISVVYSDRQEAIRDDLQTKGVLWIDETSGCLVVRQSQPTQRLLRLWLENRLKNNESSPAVESPQNAESTETETNEPNGPEEPNDPS